MGNPEFNQLAERIARGILYVTVINFCLFAQMLAQSADNARDYVSGEYEVEFPGFRSLLDVCFGGVAVETGAEYQVEFGISPTASTPFGTTIRTNVFDVGSGDLITFDLVLSMRVLSLVEDIEARLPRYPHKIFARVEVLDAQTEQLLDASSYFQFDPLGFTKENAISYAVRQHVSPRWQALDGGEVVGRRLVFVRLHLYELHSVGLVQSLQKPCTSEQSFN